MITRSDHCHWRNLRWVASGFVALVVIFSASYNPIDPGIGPGEFGDWSETLSPSFPFRWAQRSRWSN